MVILRKPIFSPPEYNPYERFRQQTRGRQQSLFDRRVPSRANVQSQSRSQLSQSVGTINRESQPPAQRSLLGNPRGHNHSQQAQTQSQSLFRSQLVQSQLRMSSLSQKTYISKREFGTQTTPKRMVDASVNFCPEKTCDGETHTFETRIRSSKSRKSINPQYIKRPLQTKMTGFWKQIRGRSNRTETKKRSQTDTESSKIKRTSDGTSICMLDDSLGSDSNENVQLPVQFPVQHPVESSFPAVICIDSDEPDSYKTIQLPAQLPVERRQIMTRSRCRQLKAQETQSFQQTSEHDQRSKRKSRTKGESTQPTQIQILYDSELDSDIEIPRGTSMISRGLSSLRKSCKRAKQALAKITYTKTNVKMRKSYSYDSDDIFGD